MRVVRTILAILLIVVGASIVVQMLHESIRYTLTGIVVGLAMIALGVVRLRALYVPVRRT
jgi:hypothetical protein